MNAFPYSGNFIGATGEYPINEKIDLTSNILNTKIDLTSNTLNKKIDDNTNATLQTIAQVDNHYKLMIDEKIETQTTLGVTFNVKHTYIMNSNTNTGLGEIRFYNQMASLLTLILWTQIHRHIK
jgi:asparagine N-glycosylation enzyme membrane subunit Stt3